MAIQNQLQLYRCSYDSGLKNLIRGDYTKAEDFFNHAIEHLDEYNAFMGGKADAKVASKKKEISHLIDLIEERDNFTPLKENAKSNDEITFDDVVGLNDVKQTINRMIVYPYKYKSLYKTFNRKSGGGIILYGLPGTGKTMIVKAIANEINAHLISVKASDIISKWCGESEKNIKAIFDEAREHETSIIYFDEFEALGSTREKTTSPVSDHIVCELLSEMDGFEAKDSNTTLVVMASTNKPWSIDSALMRSGRFNQKIYVPLPDEMSRTEIMKKQLLTCPTDSEFTIDEIVNKTCGFNCADMVEIANRLKDLAIERSILSSNISPITKKDIDTTLATMHSSVNLKDIEQFENYNQQFTMKKQ